MINYLKAYLFYLPQISKIELRLTKHFYLLANASHELKSNLFYNHILTDDKGTDLNYLNAEIRKVKETFKKLPHILQVKHLSEIELYEDAFSDSYDYMNSAIVARGIIYNYLLMSYAEIILPNLKKEEKNDFLKDLDTNLSTIRLKDISLEDCEQKIIYAWKLENELISKPKAIKKTVAKI